MAATTITRSPDVTRFRFRSFMGMWCLVVAALPVAASEFGLIPIYESQRRILPAYAAFFCFLGFAYVFSLRHRLARAMFGARLLWREGERPDARRRPLFSIHHLLACLILASLACAATYLWAFESGRGSPTFPALPRSSADAVVLALSYVAMFVLAETALAIMAAREYLQDVLGLSDADAIMSVPSGVEPVLERTWPNSGSPTSGSLAFSYRVVPGGTANNPQSQFDSERDIAPQARAEAPAAECFETEGATEDRIGVGEAPGHPHAVARHS